MMNILRHKMLFVLAIMTIGPLAINTSQCHAEGNGGFMRIINWLISAFLMPMATVFDRSKLYRYLDNEEKWIDKPTTSRRTKNLDYNIDGRMSVYYSWDDMFMCLNGQLSHFFYKQGKTTGQTIDWFAILSLGYCF